MQLHALQWQSLVSNDRGPSCTWTLLKWCIIEGGCNMIRHWSNKMKHFKWTRKTHPFTSPDDCAWTILPIVPCVWFRKDFIKDSNGHLQCKTRSSTLPSPRFHWLFVVVRQIQEQCGLSYLLKVYIPSLLKQVRKQPLLRTAIPDLTPGAPVHSVCVQTASLTWVYMITSGHFCTHTYTPKLWMGITCP